MRIVKIFLILLGALTIVSEGQKPPQGSEDQTPATQTPEGDIDWSFGLLNDVSLPAIGKRYPKMKGNYAVEVAKMLKESFKQNAFVTKRIKWF